MGVTSNQSVLLSQCPQCRYDISGLPATHRCPECGFTYDESMIVLEGWHVPGLASLPRFLLLYGTPFVIVLLMLRGILGWSWFVLGLITAAAIGVVFGLHLYVRSRDESNSRALVRYLISTEGVARWGGATHPWREYSHLMLLPDGNRAWRLHLYPDWWRLYGPPAVNARLECSDKEADAVRAEIQERINTARAAEAEARAKARGEQGRWW